MRIKYPSLLFFFFCSIPKLFSQDMGDEKDYYLSFVQSPECIIQVFSPQPGKIKKNYVTLAQKVEKDAMLFSLGNDSVESAYELALNEYKWALEDFENSKNIKEYITKEELELKHLQMLKAKNHLEGTKKILNELLVRAPMAGTIKSIVDDKSNPVIEINSCENVKNYAHVDLSLDSMHFKLGDKVKIISPKIMEVPILKLESLKYNKISYLRITLEIPSDLSEGTLIKIQR